MEFIYLLHILGACLGPHRLRHMEEQNIIIWEYYVKNYVDYCDQNKIYNIVDSVLQDTPRLIFHMTCLDVRYAHGKILHPLDNDIQAVLSMVSDSSYCY